MTFCQASFFSTQPHCRLQPFPPPAPPPPRPPLSFVYQDCPRALVRTHRASNFPHSLLSNIGFSLRIATWSAFHAGFLHGLTPPLCVYAACVLFLSLYLPPWNSLLCIWPREPHPNPHTLSWVSPGCGQWRSHLTEQVAWLQLRPQQCRLTQPIFNAPRCVFATSAFPLLFIIWVKMQSWVWREVVHTEEK